MIKFGLNRMVLFALGIAAAGIVTYNSFSQNNNVQIGKAEVRAIRGTAKYATTKTAQFVPLKVGTVLRPGAIIQTGPESNVDLFLDKNGPVVRVTSNSTLSLEKLTWMATGAETIIDTQLNLRAGRILGNVRKLAAASKYEITTPTGIAGIRGTEYDISADGTITVISGVVIFVYLDPQSGNINTVTVREGETFRPGGTVRPAPPEVLERIREAIEQAGQNTGPGGGTDTPAVVVVEDDPFVSSTTGSPQ